MPALVNWLVQQLQLQIAGYPMKQMAVEMWEGQNTTLYLLRIPGNHCHID
jgi:hypothetical protein